MSVASLESVSKDNSRLIRKALGGSVFVKRYEDADPEIKTIWTQSGGLIIPSGYQPLGLIKKSDAVAWARETDSADVESWGYGEPTRRDLTKDVSTCKVTAQESKKQVFEAYNGVDLSQVKPDSDKNIVIDKPRRPQSIDWRVLVVSKDGDGPDAIYFARWMPYARVTGIEDQQWGEEDELTYGMTFTGFTDAQVGTALREIWGGPGIDPEAMGFES